MGRLYGQRCFISLTSKILSVSNRAGEFQVDEEEQGIEGVFLWDFSYP